VGEQARRQNSKDGGGLIDSSGKSGELLLHQTVLEMFAHVVLIELDGRYFLGAALSQVYYTCNF
jgi:hypothetical protein